MNRKGFTLVELLATLIILAIVMSLGTYSIINIINNSKNKNYDVLISNIKDSAETYYQECKFAQNSIITCTKDGDGYTITLGDLVTYGYLKGNSKDDEKKFTIVNPKDNNSIAACTINVTYNNGIAITANNPTGSCPTQADYNK